MIEDMIEYDNDKMINAKNDKISVRLEIFLSRHRRFAILLCDLRFQSLNSDKHFKYLAGPLNVFCT